MRHLIALLLLALLAVGAAAREARPLADDEAVEQRLIAIADELRCLVCQNESLAGSRAELAQDLRREQQQRDQVPHGWTSRPCGVVLPLCSSRTSGRILPCSTSTLIGPMCL